MTTTSFRSAPLSLLYLLLAGCSSGTLAVPPQADSGDEPAFDTPPEVQGGTQPAPWDGCSVRWLGPEPDWRTGHQVTALVETALDGVRIDRSIRAWATGPTTGSALIEPLNGGRQRVTFTLPEDGDWQLCAACEHSPSGAGRACTDGWRIDNVAPQPPTNLRRASP